MLQCERIAAAVEEHEQAAASDSSARLGVSLCVEGNISAGKSTFLQLMEQELNLRSPGGGPCSHASKRRPQVQVCPMERHLLLQGCCGWGRAACGCASSMRACASRLAAAQGLLHAAQPRSCPRGLQQAVLLGLLGQLTQLGCTRRWCLSLCSAGSTWMGTGTTATTSWTPSTRSQSATRTPSRTLCSSRAYSRRAPPFECDPTCCCIRGQLVLQ